MTNLLLHNRFKGWRLQVQFPRRREKINKTLKPEAGFVLRWFLLPQTRLSVQVWLEMILPSLPILWFTSSDHPPRDVPTIFTPVVMDTVADVPKRCKQPKLESVFYFIHLLWGSPSPLSTFFHSSLPGKKTFFPWWIIGDQNWKLSTAPYQCIEVLPVSPCTLNPPAVLTPALQKSQSDRQFPKQHRRKISSVASTVHGVKGSRHLLRPDHNIS